MSLTSLIIQYALAAIVWFVLPPFLGGFVKKKSNRKAIAILCKIIGIVMIAIASIDFVTSLSR